MNRMGRWFDRLAHRSLSVFLLLGLLLIVALALGKLKVLAPQIWILAEWLGIGMAILSILSPLWLEHLLSRKPTGQRNRSQFLSRLARRASRWADHTPYLLLIMGLALFVSLILPGSGKGIRDSIAGGLCIGMVVLASLALIVWTLRGDAQPEEPAPVRPDRQPGHRKWKSNVYDENAYAILGLAQDATQAEVHEAFRKLAKKYHPDAVPPKEKERTALVFVRIDQAYELLSDPENRARYDTWIEHLDGGEPMLDSACDVFQDPVSCASFDGTFYPRRPAGDEDDEDAEMERNQDGMTEAQDENGAPSVANLLLNMPPSHGEQPSQEERTCEAPKDGSPPEVDIPDSVREALGLSPVGDATCTACGQLLGPMTGPVTLCEKCRNSQA